VWLRGLGILLKLASLTVPLAASGDSPAGNIAATNGAELMQIEIEMDTGLAYMPGLAKPVTIEVDQLPEQEAQQLRGLVAAARFFDQPAQLAPATTRGADLRSFTITVTEGTQRHTVTVKEPIEDEPIRRLVRHLETQVRAARRRGVGSQTP
jgi:hypothetical protein